MPPESQLVGTSFTPFLDLVWVALKGLLILLFGLYFAFSLVILRQVNLMTETLITGISPVLRGLAIVHAGLALGLTILFIGLLFG